VTTQFQHEIGTDFVGYRIEALIGRGAMGVVYRAYDLRLKRTVALKLVAPELALDARFRTRFVRETELAMSLEHPNVVPIYDAGDVDSRLYLAMRLVDGSDLRALLRNEGRLNAARALAICRQVGAALDAAHAKGLVHCDVKPSNVLVDRNDHVYVADLGLSRRLEDQRPGDDRSIGTPAYLAPEQIEGALIDGRADVYSLGCLLYQCLTGELPFVRDSRLAMAWAHLEEEPPNASDEVANLPPNIDHVLRRAMAKVPDERYSSCAAFLEDAEQALGFGRPDRVVRKRLLLGAGVAVLSAAAVSVLLFRNGGPAPSAPVVRPNTLVRIDPKTNTVRAVIGVPYLPSATAVAGGSVWVYSHGAGTLSEIDAETNSVRQTVRLRASPTYLGLPYGPALAADRDGAWIAGVDQTGASYLTSVRRGGAKRDYRLDVEPKGVAVGEGAVWVLGSRHGDQLLRVDPRTGAIAGRKRFPAATVVNSVTAGLRAVWVAGSSPELLYSIDPRRLAIRGRVPVGKGASRPVLRYGDVWIGASPGTTLIVDPISLKIRGSLTCCPPEEGSSSAGFGSTWMISWPTGGIVRFDADTRQVAATIHLTDSAMYGGPCETSIAAGAGAVWVTVSPSGGYSCLA